MYTSEWLKIDFFFYLTWILNLNEYDKGNGEENDMVVFFFVLLRVFQMNFFFIIFEFFIQILSGISMEKNTGTQLNIVHTFINDEY